MARLLSAPPDYQQGETVRIMFVHVPAAWLAMLVYTVMALGQRCGHHLPPSPRRCGRQVCGSPHRGRLLFSCTLPPVPLEASPCGAPGGCGMRGSPHMFVLFLLYAGYMAIWQAIEGSRAAPR